MCFGERRIQKKHENQNIHNGSKKDLGFEENGVNYHREVNGKF